MYQLHQSDSFSEKPHCQTDISILKTKHFCARVASNFCLLFFY